MQSHDWRLARQRLHTWLSTYVGPRRPRCGASYGTPLGGCLSNGQQSSQRRQCGRHTWGSQGRDMGTKFIQQVLAELQKVWLVHTRARDILINTRAGPRGTMAWVLRELQLHQQAERPDVPWAALS